MRIPLVHLLAKSPLPRVEEQMQAVLRCAAMVPQLVEKLKEGDQEAIVELAKEASRLESLADDVKSAVREHMPIKLFLPVDRRDVLRLVSEIDAIADCAEDVGVLLTLRPLELPEGMAPLLEAFVQRVMETVEAAAKLADTIDDLIAAGFAGRPAERARVLIDGVHRREHEADKLQDQCAKVLFASEERLSPVAIFMWTKVLNKIGDMANHAENVGEQFRLFLAR